MQFSAQKIFPSHFMNCTTSGKYNSCCVSPAIGKPTSGGGEGSTGYSGAVAPPYYFCCQCRGPLLEEAGSSSCARSGAGCEGASLASPSSLQFSASQAEMERAMSFLMGRVEWGWQYCADSWTATAAVSPDTACVPFTPAPDAVEQVWARAPTKGC